MAARAMTRRSVVGMGVMGTLILALCLQVVLALSPASANDGEPPSPPTDCLADRVPLAPTATISWNHDGNNVEKFIVEKSRNDRDFSWDGAPLAPLTEHVITELAPLDVFDVRVRAKAPDGTFSEFTDCTAVVNAADRIDLAIDPTLFVPRPAEVVGLGAGLNWLLDSDLHRPRTRTNVEAINDLGAGILRFPFGHLSDNYLWNTPPWNANLEPRIASQHETPGLLTPGNRDWSWAVNPDGSFIDAMDFHEFIDIAAQTSAKTVVVVNAAAHEYQDGPTYEELRDTAVEWVRHAMDNGLQVDHWQIGNEADHPNDGALTSAEYSALYLDFAAAMRAVDPTISVGPGLIGLSPYSDEVLAAIDTEIDFAGVHQYLQYDDHHEWRTTTSTPIPNVVNMQQLVDQSASPGVPILVTETNSLGLRWDNGDAITTTKALALFEMLVHQHLQPNVAASLVWTTHTPWSGETFIGDDANLFFNDDQNQLTPNGMAAQLFAETMDTSRLLEPPPPQANIRLWPSVNETTGAVVVHLLNKGTFDQEVQVTVDGAFISGADDRIVFAGLSPDDPSPARTTDNAVTVADGAASTVVPAHGLVVVELEVVVPPDVVINEIHYNPAGAAAEFIELFNREADTVDMSGFVIDGLVTLPPGTTIEPGGFLVFTNDLDAFAADHPAVPAIEWNVGEDLDNDGEKLELRTPEGAVVDVVEYG